jgi:S-adenosylmethionine decarboxylase
MFEDVGVSPGEIPVGSEWLVDAHGCRPEALRSLALLQGLFDRILADLGLHAVADPVWRVFTGAAGVSGLQLLSESHLTCHTFPERGLATFNLYSCRSRQPWPWDEHLSAVLGAKKTVVTAVDRGQMDHASAGEAVDAASRRTL